MAVPNPRGRKRGSEAPQTQLAGRQERSQEGKTRRKTGKRARESPAVRALVAGIPLEPLAGVGPERAKLQKALSKKVCRAEQTAQKRDARNAWQKAYKQVITCIPRAHKNPN